jgi:FHA domain
MGKKLILKFGNTVLKEMFVGGSGVSVGRAPDSGLVIDNPAVSYQDAKFFFGPEGSLMVEDHGSLNGTSVNGQRVARKMLQEGDRIDIGKHRIFVEDSNEMDGFLMYKEPAKPSAPKVAETVMLGTKDRHELLLRLASQGECSQPSPERHILPVLVVRRGKTSDREYVLTDNLTVIGKSSMATVRLRGWFAPKAAAQINRREDGTYYLAAIRKVPSVNGHPTTRPTRLVPGDIIDVGGVTLEFEYRH